MRKWLTIAFVAMLVLAFASPAMANPPKRPIVVSHPRTFTYRHKVGKDFKVWGYVRPRLASGTEATLTIVSQRWNGRHSWVATSGLDTTAALSPSGKFKHATNYKTTLSVGRTGFYRMRAILEWTGAKGVVHVRKSLWKYYRIVK